MTFDVATIGSILGSVSVGSIISGLAMRKKAKAEAKKLDNESGKIGLDKELKLVEFYRSELDAQIRLNRQLLNTHTECEKRLDMLESKYNELQRQFTLLKIESLNK